MYAEDRLNLSSDEKVAILSAVNIFAKTPAETLGDIATLLKQVSFSAGDTIINKGDHGDCMYFIVRGVVRVHDGDRTLNTLTVAQVFGEVALLDAEPRVASVTALEDADLLRLDQDVFYNLMATRPEVSRGIIRVLAQHLRSRVHDMAEDFVYMQAMGQVTAAAVALEAGKFEPSSLEQVCTRTDSLGQLARVFQKMATEVQSREQRLKQEVMELRIQIDETKKKRDVDEVTQSAYFRDLQDKLKTLRKAKT